MGTESEGSQGSIYGVSASWLTPSSLFIVINLVIGTIAITSRFATPRKRQLQLDDTPTQLVRSPSLLDRVTSFRLGHYKYEPVETEPVENTMVLDRAQSSSLLDRVKSFGLGSYKYEQATPMENEPVENHDSAQLDRAQSFSLLDRVRSFDLGLYKIEAQESPDPDDPIQNQLTRAPSFLERIMSWKLIGRSESIKAEENKPGTEPKPKPKSETETMGGGEDLVEGRGEEEGVDAKADDFIKRFKQQLRLERLDSILRYRDMLQRRH